MQDPWKEIVIKHTIAEAERLKTEPSPHYDVEEGSTSDDPSDLNHLIKITNQFHSSLTYKNERIRDEMRYLEMLSRRMCELAENAHKKYEIGDCNRN